MDTGKALMCAHCKRSDTTTYLLDYGTMKGSEGKQEQRGKAVIFFSAPLVRRLATDQIRLPPTYVGVRRVRPSSRLVHKAMQSSAVVIPSKTPVVFKIVDATTGQERRMTSKEKKILKFQRTQEQKEQKAALKLSSANSTPIEESDSSKAGAVEDNLVKEEGRYMQLEVDASVLEQELADLRGERDGVPPVVLSQSMAAQAFQQGIITKDANHSAAVSDEMQTQQIQDVVVDDVLGGQWAEALKKSMVPAEATRQREEMRPMPYQLVPETWVRMRPTLGESPSVAEVVAKAASPPVPADEKAWSYCQIRPTTRLDADLAAVVQLLHRGTNLHLSCGAKFGCDFLLYDGSRNERHAFAGLRVLHCEHNSSNNDATSSDLPLPTAYDMAGYVRCLNTAGKLSLLATVVTDDTTNTRRVALVDLALEKILQTSSRRSNKKTIADRKRTLAKT
jgi:hypothetical protein